MFQIGAEFLAVIWKHQSRNQNCQQTDPQTGSLRMRQYTNLYDLAKDLTTNITSDDSGKTKWVDFPVSKTKP